DTANGVGGSQPWTYTLDNTRAQELAEGQTVTETFSISVSDGQGSTPSQTVTITITGTNDDVVITSATQAGTVTEDADLSASPSDSLVASGAVTFSDVDLADTHSATFTGTAVYGSFTLGMLTDTANGVGGSQPWTYTLDNTRAQELAEGQTVTETFSISVSDGQGSTLSQTVTITITGTNDDPIVTTFSDGAVTEDATDPSLTTTVSVDFSDIDTRDVLSYSQTKTSGSLGGTLTLLSSDDSGTTGTAGSVSYTYSVANSAAQYLAVGETASETFTITADDGNGGMASQVVTVTVTGTNDQPTVTAFSDGAVTEDATSPELSTTVSANFSDIDTRDVLSYSQTKTSGSLGGTLSLLSSDDSGTTGTAGSVSYTYSVANSATQFLAAGQTATETFTITANDGNGGMASQVVTATVTGTNDEVVLTSATQAGTVT
ncbi:VCBS domain-containing protein, partial [Piscinibacter sp. Jin2]